MHPSVAKIKNKLIVSCQAEGDSPFNSPEGVAMFAKAAEIGGAGGIRSEGILKTKKIIETTSLPVVGLVKGSYDDGYVMITRELDDVKQLVEIGTNIIAIDGTFRKHNQKDGPDFISFCKSKFPNTAIMADISNVLDTREAILAGADIISTTLRGYTPETSHLLSDFPDIEFIAELNQQFSDFPIVAEGRISDVDQMKKITGYEIWSVVIGSAITRPHLITNRFVNALPW